MAIHLPIGRKGVIRSIEFGIVDRSNFSFVQFTDQRGAYRYELQPYEKNRIIKLDWKVDKDINLFQIDAHTHTRGVRLELKMLLPNGKSENLCRVETYQINAQARFASSVLVPKGSVLSSIFTFDNSAENPRNPDPSETVRSGPTLNDEMSTNRLFYTIREDYK